MKNQEEFERNARKVLNRTMEQLEDRLLFDAVPDGGFLIEPEADTHQPEQLHSVQTQDAEQSVAPKELILVDSNVEDADLLISEILKTQRDQSFEVRLLSAESDGIETNLKNPGRVFGII